MKSLWKRLLILGSVSVFLCALLTGCGGLTAGELVQNNMDVLYLNQCTDEYLKAINSTREEAEQDYENGIDVEVQIFADYFAVELDVCDASVEESINALYHQIYPHSKYEIGSVVMDNETYLVSVTIYPIDIFAKAMEHIDEFTDPWLERINAGEFENATDAEYETAWGSGIVEFVSGYLDTMDYLEPQTISVQVKKNSEGAYTVDESDFQRIDTLIIDYSATVG